MERRKYLRELGTGITVGVTALSGCGGDGTEGEETVAEETEAAVEATETTAPEETAPEETATGTETGTESVELTNTIEMITEGNEFVFNPIGLYVEVGETITWVNGSGSHSSTAYTEQNPQSEVNRIPNEAEGWNSEILSEEGAEFTHTFEVPGTYDYYCIPHKSLGMVARLVVGEPSGVEGDPPDGPVPTEEAIVEEGLISQEMFNP